MRKAYDIKVHSAKVWAAILSGEGRESKVASRQEPSEASESSRVKKWVPKLNLESAKALRPPGSGCHLWHEITTDRIRIASTAGGHKRTFSAPVHGNLHAAIVMVLQWGWKQHVEVGGDMPPKAWKELQ
eukprot:6233248-Lingulodinium_polyedra.AAC.1